MSSPATTIRSGRCRTWRIGSDGSSATTPRLILLAHSHVAEIAAPSNGRWYANPGRWAPDLDGAYPYLDIVWDERSLTVELWAWDAAARRSRPVSVGRLGMRSEPGLI